jgi:hypothetical protein
MSYTLRVRIDEIKPANISLSPGFTEPFLGSLKITPLREKPGQIDNIQATP